MSGIGENRVFDRAALEELKEQAAALMKCASEVTEELSVEMDALLAAVSQIPEEARHPGLESGAESLKGKLDTTVYDDLKVKLTENLEKLITLIPLYDSQSGAVLTELSGAAKSICSMVEELKSLIRQGSLTLSLEEFREKLVDCEKKWQTERQRLEGNMQLAMTYLKGLNLTSAYSKDPVNLSTGNFFYEKEDLTIQGRMPLVFKRYYNSIDRGGSWLGAGWSHSHGEYLEKAGEDFILHKEDGKEITFRKEGENYRDIHTGTEILYCSRHGYIYEEGKREFLYFGEEGRLESRKDKDGNEIRYETDEEGRVAVAKQMSGGGCFFFIYGENGFLKEVQDHTGRTLSFFYMEGKLSEVTDPAGNTVSYRYEEEGRIWAVKNPVGTFTVKNIYDEKGRVISQRFPDKGEMHYDYEDGKRTILTERNGSRITYVQDERYRNTDILYEDGTKEHFDYNEKNHRIRYVDRNGNNTRMAYDDRGNLTQVINALGEKTNLTYNADNRLISLKVNGKEKLHNSYDTTGNLVYSRGADGNGDTITYDSSRRPVRIETADKSVTQIVYDERGNIRKIVATDGVETHYEYDDLNRVIRSIDGNGNRTFFEYDAVDRIRKVINPMGMVRSYSYNASGKVTKVTDYDGYVVETEYNSLNKPESIKDKEGNLTHFYYDKMWNVSRVIQADGGSSSYLYDGNNRLCEEHLPEGGWICYTYDGNGNRTGITDANGNHTSYAYDALNRMVKVTDAVGAETNYAYDEDGNITGITDAMGNVTVYTYDEMKRCTSKTDALGNSTVYSYDEMGNIKNILYPNGGMEKRFYKYGRLSKIEKADGSSMCYAYDGNGNCIEMENGVGEKLILTYDALDRTRTITNPNGGKLLYDYDALGNVIKMTDENGNETSYTYTPNGNLASVTDALGNKIRYSYDAMGRLIKTERFGELPDGDAADGKVGTQTTVYTWNQEGLVTGITDPLGAVETFAYDKGGRMTDKWDRDGYHTGYIYDGRNLMTDILYGDGTQVSYSYDSLRRLEKIKDSTGTTRIVMDALGRALSITDGQGKTVGYEWDSMNEKTRLIYPDGKEVAYQYNERGLLEALTTGKGTVHYAYDKIGRLKEKKLPNGITTGYDYNRIGRLEKIYHTGNGFREEYRYQYDIAGNKTGVEKLRSGIEEDSGSFSYSYDALRRLTEVTKDGALLRKYSYDAFGNRTIKEDYSGRGKEQTLYHYNANNQLISQISGSEKKSYTYDRRGNLTTVSRGEELLKAFTFDAANRMSSATALIEGVEKRAEYCYNGFGQRVEKKLYTGRDIRSIAGQIPQKTKNPEQKIHYILDMTRPYHNLLMKEEMGQEEQTFYWDGNVAAMEELGRDSYYLQDDLGSPMQLLDEIGKVRETYGFDEFGMSIGRSGFAEKSIQPFGFTGYQMEETEGLYFAQSRRYDAQTGRFISEDRIRGNIVAPYTLNQYGYCWNRPADFVDLNGKFPWIVIPLIMVVSSTLTGCTDSSNTQLETPEAGNYKYKYSPEVYNSAAYIDRTNCYAYAFDVISNPITERAFYDMYTARDSKLELPFANQPGLFSGQYVPLNFSIVSGDEVGNQKLVELVKADAKAIGLNFQEYKSDMTGGYAVLLVVKPGGDYHWYRQDIDGTWSHKLGSLEVTTGVLDPVQDAKALGYMTIVGYYYITEDCGIE